MKREVGSERAGRSTAPTVPKLPETGRPLDASTASRMGAVYGHNFADVRIHDDPEAANLAAREHAVAVTVGTDIAFAPGAYRPGTQAGDALLAHELAHVQQQRDGVGLPGASHEADAHEATIGAVAHLAGAKDFPRPRPSRSSAVAVQRCTPSWAPPMPEGALTPSNGRAFVTGPMADTMLKNSPTVGPYVASRIETGPSRCIGSPVPQRSEGHVHFHPDAEWEQTYMNYAARHVNTANPKSCTGYPRYTEAEARAEAPSVRGFEDEGELHVNELTGQLATPLHEAIHRYEHDDFTDLAFAISEGATEYFTRKVAAEQTPPLFRDGYPDELDAITTMVETGGIGIGPLADAYFNGNIGALREAIDKNHPGRFAQWKDLLDRPSPDFASANALFTP